MIDFNKNQCLTIPEFSLDSAVQKTTSINERDKRKTHHSRSKTKLSKANKEFLKLIGLLK